MKRMKWRDRVKMRKKIVISCVVLCFFTFLLYFIGNSKNKALDVYWINLDNAIDRRNSMISNIGSKYISVRIRATNEKEAERMIMMRKIHINGSLAYKNKKGVNTWLKHVLKNEYTFKEVALSISHLRAVKQAYDDGNDIALILEDDAILTPKFLEMWRAYISKAPADWELINLYTTNRQAILHLNQLQDLFVHWNAWYWGSTAYILNRKGMKKILEKYVSDQEYFINDRIVVSDELMASATVSYQATRPLVEISGSVSSIQSSEKFLLDTSFGNKINRLIRSNTLSMDEYKNSPVSVLIITKIKDRREQERLRAELDYIRSIHDGTVDIAILKSDYTINNSIRTINNAIRVDNLAEIDGNHDLILLKNHGLSLQGFAWKTFLNFSKYFTIIGAMPAHQDHFNLRKWVYFNKEFDIFKLRTWAAGNKFDKYHGHGSYGLLHYIETDVLPTSFALIHADFFKWYVRQETPNAYSWCGAAQKWSKVKPCGLIPIGVKQVETHLLKEDHATNSKWYSYSKRFRDTDLQEYFSKYDLWNHFGVLSFTDPFTYCKSTKYGTISIVLNAHLTPENVHANIFLHKSLQSILNVQQVDEIIILDSSSIPPLETWPSITSLIDSRVKIIREERNSFAISDYNKLFCEATGEIIIKVDVDNILESNFVDLNNLKRLKKKTYVSGMWWEALTENEKHLNGVFAAYRQDIFAIRGYDQRMHEYGWDDSDIYIRLNLMSDISCCGSICQQVYLKNFPQKHVSIFKTISIDYIDDLVRKSLYRKDEIEESVNYAQQIGVFCPNVRIKVAGVRHEKHLASKGGKMYDPNVHMGRIATFNPWYMAFPDDVNLFISRTTNLQTRELDASIEVNLRNPVFRYVFVLLEDITPTANCNTFARRISTFAPINKLKCFEWEKKRPTYQQLYEYTYNLPTSGVVVFSNSDVAFDKTIAKVRTLVKNKLNVISVTGNAHQSPTHIFETYKRHVPVFYIQETNDTPYDVCDPSWKWSGLSWDAYVFRVDSHVDFKNAIYNKLLYYKENAIFMNQNGAENAAALAFFYSGLNKKVHKHIHPRHLEHQVFSSERWHPDNICLHVNAWHLHLSEKTHSNKLEDRVEHNNWLDAGASIQCTFLEECSGINVQKNKHNTNTVWSVVAMSTREKELFDRITDCSRPQYATHFDCESGVPQGFGSCFHVLSQRVADALEKNGTMHYSGKTIWSAKPLFGDFFDFPWCFSQQSPVEIMDLAGVGTYWDYRSPNIFYSFKEKMEYRRIFTRLMFRYLKSSVLSNLPIWNNRLFQSERPDLTVHIRWGDKTTRPNKKEVLKGVDRNMESSEENDIGPYIDAVTKLTKMIPTPRIFVMTVSQKALDEFKKFAPTHWEIVADPAIDIFKNADDTTYGIANDLQRGGGNLGFETLKSIIVGAQSKYFVLNTESNMSRLLNEVRSLFPNTVMIDIARKNIPKSEYEHWHW